MMAQQLDDERGAGERGLTSASERESSTHQEERELPFRSCGVPENIFLYQDGVGRRRRQWVRDWIIMERSEMESAVVFCQDARTCSRFEFLIRSRSPLSVLLSSSLDS